MLIKILLGLAVIIVGIIIASRFQPHTYTVERTGTIAAPPSVVFAQLIDFRNWVKFDPCMELDANAVFSYEGPESGVGAKYHWTSNAAGKGSMVITEISPDKEVKFDMHTLEPWESHATSAFQLVPDGNGTKLTWSMTGEHNFISKIMNLFKSMDEMIGGQYERGFERMNNAFVGSR
jgi:hypothetical protein